MKPLGKLLYILTYRLVPYIPGWSRLRVRTLLIDGNGNVLLIKGWFSTQQWTLPGGGVNTGESERAASVREIKEETGYDILETDLRYVQTLKSKRLHADLPLYKVTVLRGETLPELRFPYNLEIIDRKWFSIKNLPTEVTSHVSQAIKLASTLKN